ncbi:MAG: hypothetical protein F4Z33_02350 [Gemmatimonadales bacterium]|nr:hypothetical protein [Gemmatimonadales bacterium]
MIARYTIEHAVEFVYSAPVRGSVMTLHLHPVQDRRQVVRGFAIETDPSGPVFEFEGPFHNRGHFFDRPGTHRRLSIVGRSTVEVGPIPEAPLEVGEEAWARLDAAASAPELGLMLQPSRFVRSSPSSPISSRAAASNAGTIRWRPPRRCGAGSTSRLIIFQVRPPWIRRSSASSRAARVCARTTRMSWPRSCGAGGSRPATCPAISVRTG